MKYSVQAYLKRLPTEKLERFLEDYKSNLLSEDFSGVIDDVAQKRKRIDITKALWYPQIKILRDIRKV